MMTKGSELRTFPKEMNVCVHIQHKESPIKTSPKNRRIKEEHGL